MKKLTIIVTVPVVLETWLKGQAKFLSQFYNVEIITSYSQNIENIAKFENVKITTIEFTRKINPLKDLYILGKLFLYIRSSKSDIVYTLTPKAGLLGMIASWMARIPCRIHNVVGLPHLEATGIKKMILVMTEKITYFFASHLYSNSKNLATIVSKLSKKNIGVIGQGSVNGVDTKVFQQSLSDKEKDSIRRSLSFSKKDFVITYIGRIVNDKGINELLGAFIKLSKEFSYVKLLLIGDYYSETDAISDTKKRIIYEHHAIKYLEFQEDIKNYLEISNLFVLPSYREGLPNVLIEAGSYGIPLVATNINGCNEIIENEENGLLVEKKNTKSLYHAIHRLIEDEKFYNKVKSNVRKSIVDKYEQKYFWDSLIKEFQKIENNK